MLEVRLLGKFDVKHKKEPVHISSRPAQSLFAYLILNAGTSHRREKLAGMLWPDSLEETARDNLRHALWRVRKALQSASSASYLQTDDSSIAFNASAEYWLDLAELEKLSEIASADELMTVLSVYHGELLPGFYDEWVVLEREHLSSIFEHHMARLLALLRTAKRWLDVLAWGERWIKLGRRPEPAFQALMSAHAAKGDMSKVATTYERCVKSLKEFGIEPSQQTRALYERLKAGKETLETGSTVPLQEKRGDSRKTNLPVPLTSFIGREKEVAEIIQLLNKNRLVTLLGSGGVGKTRLAIRSSNKLLNKFRDGVWWVDLVALNDGSLVPKEVAKILDLIEIPNQPVIDLLVSNLASRRLLLVLDNCEHLISACAQLTDRLLSSCASLKILATSREALDIFGEVAWHVPSLSLPNAETTATIKTLNKFESVCLFAERAETLQPQFSLTEQNAKSVVQICRRLSGMPLAIELAAARVKMMSVDEIATRLDGRFDLLTSGSRTALPRHQTLRATIDWSYDLLSEPERIFFRRLSVFAGKFTVDTVEAVTAGEDVLSSQIVDLLGQLINKSLVTVEARSDESAAQTRYGMLETIREYAREKLREVGEEDRIRNRHLQFFLNLVEELEPKLEHAEQQIWLDRLEMEIDDLRRAIDWALEQDEVLVALQLVGGLRRFWFIRPYHNEGVERLKLILDRPDAKQPTTIWLKALNTYFFLLWPSGQVMEVQPLMEEAFTLGTQLGDGWNTAFVLLWLGVCETAKGNYDLARSYLELSIGMWQELKDEVYMAQALGFLGDVAMFQNDPTRAQALFWRSIPLLREAGDYPFLAIPLRRLGQLAMYEGDLSGAASLMKESLIYNWNLHDYRGSGACLAALGALSVAQGDMQRAAKLFGAVDAVLKYIRTPLLPFDKQQYEQNVLQLRDQVDGLVFKKAWSNGRAMLLEEAVEFALKETQA